jgi:hypothetical protein
MNGGGQLVLRCTAQIGSFYQEYAEVELGVPQKDPIPARGELHIPPKYSKHSHSDMINLNSIQQSHHPMQTQTLQI